MSGIPLRIFLEGSRGVKSFTGNSFFPANMFRYVEFEVRYENRPERSSRGSSRRADTAILHEKSLWIQWNCSQTPTKYIKILHLRRGLSCRGGMSEANRISRSGEPLTPMLYLPYVANFSTLGIAECLAKVGVNVKIGHTVSPNLFRR